MRGEFYFFKCKLLTSRRTVQNGLSVELDVYLGDEVRPVGAAVQVVAADLARAEGTGDVLEGNFRGRTRHQAAPFHKKTVYTETPDRDARQRRQTETPDRERETKRETAVSKRH